MIVGHWQSKTVASDSALSFFLPEQTLPIAEFAGTWNFAAWEPANIGTARSYVASNEEITLDATGQITAQKQCVGLSFCVSDSAPFAKLVTNPSGDFDVVENGSVVSRVFLYKTNAGKKVAVFLDAENSFGVGVPMAPLGHCPRSAP